MASSSVSATISSAIGASVTSLVGTVSSTPIFSSVTSSPTNSVPYFPSSDPDNDDDGDSDADKRQGIVYQYYFLIIVVVAIIIVALLAYFRRRSQLRKSRIANLGRNALARDVESWQPTHVRSPSQQPNAARRWVQRYNARFGTRFGRTAEEENDGLDEYGEAPPPYKAQEAALEGQSRPVTTSTANDPAVPLRTLSRQGLGKPPGYHEAVSPNDSQNSLRVSPASPSRPQSGDSDSTAVEGSSRASPTQDINVQPQDKL